MQQKVWFINDIDLNETPPGKQMDDEAKRQPAVERRQRNPALSFSLSMLLWGSGQMYIRKFALGASLMGCMLIFYSVISSVVLFRDIVLRLIADGRVSMPVFIIGAVLFVFCGLIIWVYGAVHAYFNAASLRSESFGGVLNELWPALCSLIFPGWGQFMNGQPKKGVLFLLFGVLGICSISFALLAHFLWPVLHSGADRYFLEISLSAVLVLLPACFLMWMISVHDSFWSCREPIRKRSLAVRFQFARERFRQQGVRRFIAPKIKRLAFMGLLLAITVLAGMHVFPKEYYLDNLEHVRVEMLNKEMQLLPELVGEAVVFLKQRA